MLTPQAVTVEASARDDLLDSPALLVRGRDLARAGRVAEALVDLDRARLHRPEQLDETEFASLVMISVECRLARGEIDTASALATWLEPMLDVPGLTGSFAHFGHGELAAATGEDERAAAHYLRSGRFVDDDPNTLPWRPAAALAEVRLGRRAQGAALARAHLALSRLAEAPYAVALGLRALAIVDPRGDGVALLREARAVLTDVPAARLVAQIETDLAGQLLLGGSPADQDEALALLRGAEEYAGREELWPLQGRVRRLLDRLGQPARPAPGEVLATLTTSEQRIAQLAAGGLTNREIADQLVVTVKAVEWHLSHVYRKLGIRSRTGLASALGLE